MDPTPRLTRTLPVLPSLDIAATVAFYETTAFAEEIAGWREPP